MPDFNIRAGDTDATIYVRLRDSTTGLAKTGLAYNSAGAVCSYVLPRAARAAITLATQTVTGAHSDGGFVEVDATNCKGLYRLDLPDAAIASGAYTIISIEFDGVIEESIEIPLANSVNVTQISGDSTAADNAESFFDGTGYAGTNNVIPSVTNVTGGINTGSGTITTLDGLDTAQDTQHGTTRALIGTPSDFGSGTSTIAANLQDMADNGTATYDRSTDSLQALRDHIGDGTNLTEVGGNGDHLTAINLPDQTMNITGNITGNLSGSVGSVSGAVGSVTGNVGGNVTGTVGGLATQAKADVNAEVVDALNTDTYAEPGQGAPAATASLAAKLGYLYKAWRNKSTQSATEYTLYADDGSTTDHKATVSDDGTTATKGEVGTGA